MSPAGTQGSAIDDFALDARRLNGRAIQSIRLGFGIGGVVALILGVLLLVWPARTLTVVAVFFGIHFLISGVIRLALGVFVNGISGGMRALSILLGILLVVVGIIALRNLAVTTAALLMLVVVVVGVGWIVEGVLSLVESRGAPSTGWAIASGIISILAGIAVLAIPGWSAWWLIVMTGVVLVVLGILSIVRAFQFGRGAAVT